MQYSNLPLIAKTLTQRYTPHKLTEIRRIIEQEIISSGSTESLRALLAPYLEE